MKKLFLYLLCQGSLDSFCQQAKPDTVRASLLMTYGHMQIAHNYEGYAIRQGEKITGYLDDKKRPFKASVRVWGYLVKEEGGKP
jgi:hypothetical protein